MGEYTGLAMFLWIVGAPTIGFLILSLPLTRRQALSQRGPETDAQPPRRRA